ncbi:hypothetical protein [Arachidicoccus terrestris]|uniref:hypothetical protein n=1 Tax=Arachidicoccus terrestris TaxID=2875539 RepID=UPI001CC5D0F0|nr:hypothetical protein [Arachidicoccus terrestris]UAY55954.1 hypothetical protein K9M52_02665 [Arachidicoccus terrestris]
MIKNMLPPTVFPDQEEGERTVRRQSACCHGDDRFIAQVKKRFERENDLIIAISGSTITD